jgi:redox-sensitive bicupin YhaK (pirin superfamily)
MSAVQVIRPREVPLGGLRAMTVRRTLPSRERAFVGAWCFADHYGPDDVAATGGMDVAPHPHAGLATVSWLFTGEVEHRDSAGVHAMVLPGELNLMTAGAGIAHSEVSTPQTSVLHGVQLWVVLPAAQAGGPRDFQHYAPEPVDLPGVALRVFIGALAGSVSPVRTATPLLGAEARLAVGARWQIPVGAGFEHAVLVDSGEVTLNGCRLLRGELGVVDAGPERLDLATTGDGPARLLLLGGEPFDEPVVMWWNFIGRSHDEIARQREQWESGAARFGHVPGYSGAVERIPAPALPNVRLRPRTRRVAQDHPA